MGLTAPPTFHLAWCPPSLRVLELTGCSIITDSSSGGGCSSQWAASSSPAGRLLPQLTTLRLNSSLLLLDAAHLTSLTTLRTLGVANTLYLDPARSGMSGLVSLRPIECASVCSWWPQLTSLVLGWGGDCSSSSMYLEHGQEGPIIWTLATAVARAHVARAVAHGSLADGGAGSEAPPLLSEEPPLTKSEALPPQSEAPPPLPLQLSVKPLLPVMELAPLARYVPGLGDCWHAKVRFSGIAGTLCFSIYETLFLSVSAPPL